MAESVVEASQEQVGGWMGMSVYCVCVCVCVRW